VKYNSSGMQQWYKTYQYDSTAAGFAAVRCDDSGYVYVAGSGYGKGDSLWNVLVFKFSPAGEMPWQYLYDKSYAISAVDLAIVGENIYVLAGTSSGASVVKFKNFTLGESGS